jgi:hypothetical protein
VVVARDNHHNHTQNHGIVSVEPYGLAMVKDWEMKSADLGTFCGSKIGRVNGRCEGGSDGSGVTYMNTSEWVDRLSGQLCYDDFLSLERKRVLWRKLWIE